MTGLVLSGGGAKGAYQIGVWKALLEHGVKFDCVSGASVGALNVALVAQGDLNLAEDIWTSISKREVFVSDYKKLIKHIGKLILVLAPLPIRKIKVINLIMRIIRAITLAGSIKKVIAEGIFDTRPLLALIDEHISFEKICRSDVEVFVCAFPFPCKLWPYKKEKGDQYYRLKEYHPLVQRKLLLASAAIPILFPSVDLGTGRIIDGSLIDNTPIYPIKKFGCERAFVVHLKVKKIPVVQYLKGEKLEIVNIVPKEALDVGVLEFKPQKCKELIDKGYKDTYKTIMENPQTFQI